MRTSFSVVLLLLAFSIDPANTLAAAREPSKTYRPVSGTEDLVPASLETSVSSETFTKKAASVLSSTAFEENRDEVLSRPSPASLGNGGEGRPVGGRKYLPVLFSALVPGAGEFYMGYKWRGAALMTAEIAAWTGYFYYHGKGLDSREAYEGFADAHWNLRKWIDHHPEIHPDVGYSIEDLEQIGIDKSGTLDWPGYIPYVSKEEDKQHYYENIGKYDWYISGWEDFDPEDYDTDREHGWLSDTPLRDEYRSMRMKSNDELDTANGFIYLSIGARVVSIVQTLYLVRSSSDGEDAVDLSQNRFRLKPRARGFHGAEIVLEYSFK